MDTEGQIQHYWEMALNSLEFSPELSRSIIEQMLQTIRNHEMPIPSYFKKLFCFKCLTIYVPGKNVSVHVSSFKKHPNLKVVSYYCLSCHYTQRINLFRKKCLQLPPKPLMQQSNTFQIKQAKRANEHKRKLITSLFS